MRLDEETFLRLYWPEYWRAVETELSKYQPVHTRERNAAYLERVKTDPRRHAKHKARKAEWHRNKSAENRPERTCAVCGDKYVWASRGKPNSKCEQCRSPKK